MFNQKLFKNEKKTSSPRGNSKLYGRIEKAHKSLTDVSNAKRWVADSKPDNHTG